MNRERIAILLALIFSSLVLGKVFLLQVVTGKTQELRAAQNRFRIKTINGERGVFYDRNGKILVENKEYRNYLYSYELAHVLGYLGEANEKELSFFGVDLGREVGKAGLEKELNNIVKGVDGGEVEEYSAMGEKIRSFSRKEPIKGRNIMLNIDLDLQILAYQLLEKEDINGAIVVSKPDGRVLALVSYPSFDANLFSRSLVGEQVDFGDLFDNKRQVMFNRVTGGTYPPASTFKIITSLAALEEKVINSNYMIEDTGVIELGDSSFSNWYWTSYGRTDGMVDVVKALARSNDIFYYKVGGELGIDKLAFWSRKLGLGEKTGIEIGGEESGLVPDRQWKKEILGEDWYSGETYITAIGQGNLLTTPMQVNRFSQIVANKGRLCRSKLLMTVGDKIVEFDEEFQTDNCEQLDIDQKNIELVKLGMKNACEGGGTAWPFFDFKIRNERIEIDNQNYREASGSGVIRPVVGCKTGTAETDRYEEIEEKRVQKLHAWFTAFAPYQDPEIVVTVFLEGGGQGSDKAALMAREVVREWIERIK